jgi:iron complex transport system permease protein
MGFSAVHIVLPPLLTHIGVAGFSIIGAGLFMYIIFFLSLRMNNTLSVLISGILLGAAANAIITLFQYSSNDIQLKSFIFWNMGSISNSSSMSGIILILIAVSTLILLTVKSKSLDIWLLGEEHAQSLGLNIKSFTFLIFLTTAILTGLSTAYFGPIAFIGIIAPHIARLIFKTNIHLLLLLTTALTGITMMLIADIILQSYATLFQSSMLPLNTIISLLSIPILAYLFIKKKEIWM